MDLKKMTTIDSSQIIQKNDNSIIDITHHGGEEKKDEPSILSARRGPKTLEPLNKGNTFHISKAFKIELEMRTMHTLRKVEQEKEIVN